MNLRKIIGFFVLIITSMFLSIDVFALEGEHFRRLSDNGEILVKTIKPNNDEEKIWLVGSYIDDFDTDNYYYSVNECNDDYSECEIKVSGDVEDTKTFKMKYYDTDEKVLKKVNEYAKKVPVGQNFMLEDLELINYLVNTKYRMYDETYSLSNEAKAINYVGALKNVVGNGNIKVEIIPAKGDGAPFFTYVGGIVVLSYKDVGYKVISLGNEDEDKSLDITKRNVLYIPDETEDTTEAYVKAANDRVKKYLKTDKNYITYGGKLTDDDGYGLSFIQTIKDFEKIFDFPKLNNEYYYFNYEGKPIEFLIVKDSKKMQKNVKHKSTDIISDVEVSTDDYNVPLDTSLLVELYAEDSDKYEEIIKNIDVDSALIYDLKLFSDSINKYVTKLEDGYFEVKIPVPENYKNKSLIVYYIKEDGSKEKYDVVISDNYATFKTNHFSVYALAEEKEVKKEDVKENENVPKTYDNLLLMLCSLVILLFGFGYTHNRMKKY